ncbi:MAG: hypothetical protein HY720_22335 [Planctomycetes bacterium]|nr:hypothetical protein [Planctomycetota bacterium]
MGLLLAAILLLVLGGSAALLLSQSPRAATAAGVGGAVAGAALGLTAAVRVLATSARESIHLPWNVPYGSFSVEIDALSAFFLLPILGLSALAAIYGAGYLSGHTRKSLGASWFFYDLLVASMAMVVVARNGVLFLVAWEAMAVSSFFLVTTDHEKESVRLAGWTYLVAAHLGTAFLLVLFLLLGREAGSLDFDDFGVLAARSPELAGVVFLLALVGFGTKAGFVPFHVWLPEAHPAAPSHVSAVMSGVMIKTGIYGLVRTLAWLGPPPAWWGWLLTAVGLVSGVLGVLFALAQHDLKRLLAYHSVENIGIIAMGLGLGLLGTTYGLPALAVLGFAGALLHVANHALFKGLLFLGAGAVAQSTGTREIEEMGGLLKRMPATGLAFLVGAVAISGLPPFNGFVSEFLIYLGAFQGTVRAGPAAAVPAVGAIAGLALIGGLAAACFTKAFGIVFLGEPRSKHAGDAREVGLAMKIPMLVLAAGCLAVGLLGPECVGALAQAVEDVAPLPPGEVRGTLAGAGGPLLAVSLAFCGFLVLAGGLALLRRRLLAGREVGTTVTWDCGYARPTPRMQYTASSFAQPLVTLFASVLRPRRELPRVDVPFPSKTAFASRTPDVLEALIYRPVFAGIGRGLARLRWLQHGRVQLYVLYIALTLVVLLAWQLGFTR